MAAVRCHLADCVAAGRRSGGDPSCRHADQNACLRACRRASRRRSSPPSVAFGRRPGRLSRGRTAERGVADHFAVVVTEGFAGPDQPAAIVAVVVVAAAGYWNEDGAGQVGYCRQRSQELPDAFYWQQSRAAAVVVAVSVVVAADLDQL